MSLWWHMLGMLHRYPIILSSLVWKSMNYIYKHTFSKSLSNWDKLYLHRHSSGSKICPFGKCDEMSENLYHVDEDIIIISDNVDHTSTKYFSFTKHFALSYLIDVVSNVCIPHVSIHLNIDAPNDRLILRIIMLIRKINGFFSKPHFDIIWYLFQERLPLPRCI